MTIRRFRTGPPALAALVSALALLADCSGSGPAGPSRPAGSSGPAGGTRATAAPAPPARTDPAFGRLEARFHAKLGVYALDTGTGRAVTFQAGTRFAYCSTYKALATGVLLQHGAPLNRVIRYRASGLVDYSPITSRHVGPGMTLAAVMAAALEYSDNTAANLLLDQLGGAHRLQQALRGIGDAATNSDRDEPSVNTAVPGDPRDTSTAQALGTDLRRFVLGQLLTAGRRALLTSWLRHNTTGGPYIRAGVPAGWIVGDKTGNGYWGTRNDIAIAWPPGRAPKVIAVLSSRGSRDATSDDALIADATRIAVAGLR
jgi:beta-lactamase class A